MISFERKCDAWLVVMAAAFVAILLAGCSDKVVPLQPVSITGSDYCAIAEKITWDVEDTPDTIRGVRRENAKWDKRCQVAKGAAKAGK